jgi:hypothetical protein
VEFTITASSGESVSIKSENWMLALGKAMPFFQMDATSMVRWVITPGAEGAVTVEDPVAKRKWTVKPKEMAVKIVALGPVRESVADAPDWEPRKEEEEPENASPPPMLTMPMKSSLAPPPMPDPPPMPAITRKATDAESVAERLFDLSMDIAGAPPEEACQRALALLQEFIPCEASSVARGSVADFHLTIAAATGPVAEQLVGTQVPFGSGYVGLCFDSRIPVQVNGVEGDERHHTDIDENTGFHTRACTCVPVLRGDEIFGVIQLLNPASPFLPEDIDVAAQVAQTLAEALGGGEA